MKRITREEVLKIDDLPEKELEVPEWKASIKVRALSLAQRNAIYNNSRDGQGKTDAEKVTLLCFIEGVSDPKFTPQDYEAIKSKSAKVIEMVCREVMTLSGVDMNAKNV